MVTRSQMAGRYAIAAVVACAALLLVVGVAHAQSNTDSGGWTHNSCAFNGSVTYNTDAQYPNYYGAAATDGPCATFVVCNAFFWDSVIADFRQVYSDWQNTTAVCLYNTAPTTNAYGYHQIRYPFASYSTTHETHAQ